MSKNDDIKSVIKSVYVYTHRNTIETDYEGEQYIAKLLIDLDFMENYVKGDTFRHWYDFYTFEDTKDLYVQASKAGAIQEIVYEKPKVVEDVNVRDFTDLAYNAMRMLEIIGESDKASEMYSRVTSNTQLFCEGRQIIREYIDVELEKANISTKVDNFVYLMIKSEKPIEVVIVPGKDEFFGNIETAIILAYDEWFDTKENHEIPFPLDYIEQHMKKYNIDAEIFIKKNKEEDI